MGDLHQDIQQFFNKSRRLLHKPHDYVIDGTYQFHGIENPFSGMVAIGDGKLVGYMDYDPNSICPTSVVLGELIEQRGDWIKFLKLYTDPMLIPIVYRFTKSDGKTGIAGSYNGGYTLTERIGLRTDKRDEVARKMLNGEELIPELFDTEWKNTARMTLKAK